MNQLTIEDYLQRFVLQSADTPQVVIPEFILEKLSSPTKSVSTVATATWSFRPEYDMDVLVALHCYLFTSMLELDPAPTQLPQLWELIHQQCRKVFPQLLPRVDAQVATQICEQLASVVFKSELESYFLSAVRHLEVFCRASDNFTAVLKLQVTCFQTWLQHHGADTPNSQASMVNSLMDVCDLAGVSYQQLPALVAEFSTSTLTAEQAKIQAALVCTDVALATCGWKIDPAVADVQRNYEWLLEQVTNLHDAFTQQPTLLHKLAYNRWCSSLRLLNQEHRSFKEYHSNLVHQEGAQGLELITELAQKTS